MTIDQFEIVGMEARDLTVLQQVARQAFFETFAHEVSDTDMQQYLESSFALDKLQREYLNADSMFFLARLNKKVIGYIKLNFKAAQTEPQNNSAMEIERIYLLKAYQDRHFGQMLLFKAFPWQHKNNAAIFGWECRKEIPKPCMYTEKMDLKFLMSTLSYWVQSIKPTFS